MKDSFLMFSRSHSFEPRVGTAQLIFGIVYTCIVITALLLALYSYSKGNTEPYMHYFMAAVFAIMAIKSFYLYHKVKTLIKHGVHTVGTLTSCDPVRGITILKAEVDVKDYGIINIETRLAGETVAHEIKRYLSEHHTDKVPVMVVGNAKRPRGMIMIRTKAGRLDPQSIELKDKEGAL